MNVANSLLFKTGEGSQLTVGELGTLIENTEADIKANKITSSKVKNKLNNLKKVQAQMVSRIEAEDKRLAAAIEAEENPVAEVPEADEIADEKEPEERSSLEQLIAATLGKAKAMGGGKVEVKKAPKKAVKKADATTEPFVYPITHPTYGGFRSESEAELFERFVNGGHLITDLVANGFTASTVNEITFNSKRGVGVTYSTEIKQRLLKEVTERFPLIPVPEGTPARQTRAAVGRMDGSGTALLELPFYPDADKNPLSGFFTNDPRVTLYQMDLGLKVFVPKALREDPTFVRNPSIEIDKKTGEVKRVKPSPTEAGISNAGDRTLRGVGGRDSWRDDGTMRVRVHNSHRTTTPPGLDMCEL
jgi:hypothetical protein